MKRNLLLLTFLLTILSCGNKKAKVCNELSYKKDSATTIQSKTYMHPIADSRLMSCDKGYQIRADYAGLKDQMSITVLKDGKQQGEAIELYSDSTAASGAKYSSKNGEISFWESQGKFTYYKDDKIVCECEDK